MGEAARRNLSRVRSQRPPSHRLDQPSRGGRGACKESTHQEREIAVAHRCEACPKHPALERPFAVPFNRGCEGVLSLDSTRSCEAQTRSGVALGWGISGCLRNATSRRRKPTARPLTKHRVVASMQQMMRRSISVRRGRATPTPVRMFSTASFDPPFAGAAPRPQTGASRRLPGSH